MVLWEGSWCEGRLTKQVEMPHGFLGRFFGAKVDSQKKLETPHGFLGRFFGAKVDSLFSTWFSGKVLWCKGRLTKKDLKRHMVFWEGSLVRKSTHKKEFEKHMVFWEGSLVRRSTHKKNLKRHMVFWEGSLVRRFTKKT